MVQAHPDLKGDASSQAVDQQSWDPRVKALTGSPSVVATSTRTFPEPNVQAVLKLIFCVVRSERH
jgi:hypothetical protein